MPGDHSRFTFDPRRRFAGVRMQQGRVQLDADWNEEHDILAERARLLALDAGGPAWLPKDTTPDAFKVGVIAGDLSLGEGRLWLGGRLAEIFPGEGVTYLHQPFLPDPAPVVPGTDTIVYLDMWERDVSWAEDPRLLDVALGGIDTTIRVQQVWQVRLQGQQGAMCGTDLNALLPPSAGRLTTQAVAPPAPDDPCILPPVAGYRGIENRLYRAEIQVPGGLGTAKFKWSRDNASIMARVSALAVAGGQTRVSVNRIGRDEVLRFRIGDWVTLIDDAREFHAEAGQMARIFDIDEANRVIILDRAVPTGGGRGFAATAAAHATRATRLQRWDQSAPINALDGDGLMTTGAGPIGLEDGVELIFSVAPAGGSFQVGDCWVFAARTADASVEVLTAAPPRGIRHQRLQLAAITAGGVVTDCRPKPPQDEGCCTFVVASGEDIQAAIDKLPDAGGCVCLKAGLHTIDKPVDITRGNVHLHGESLGAILQSRRGTSLLRIVRAAETRVDTITFHQPEAEKDPVIIVADAHDTGISDCRLLLGGRNGNTGLLATGADGLVLSGLRVDRAMLGLLINKDSQDVRIESCHFAMEPPRENLANTIAVAVTSARGNLEILDCIVEDAVNGIIVNEKVTAPQSSVFAPLIRGNRVNLVTGGKKDWCFAIDAAARGAQIIGNVIHHEGGQVSGVRVTGHGAQVRGNHILSRAKAPELSLAIGAGVARPAKALGMAGGIVRQIIIADNIIEGAQHGIAVNAVVHAEVRGNRIGRAGEPNGLGIALIDCDDSRVDGNAISNALVAIGSARGARNRISGNHIEDGESGIVLADEIAPTIDGNSLFGPTKLGIMLLVASQRVAVTNNRLNRCCGEADKAIAIGAAGVQGEWQVSDNDIIDTGLTPASSGPGAATAMGIFGYVVVEARIESNMVSYSAALRLPDAEDRALMLHAWAEYDVGDTVIGYGCHVHHNSFIGTGKSALVEIIGVPIVANMFNRFERLLYSGNDHWHWNNGASDATTTVRLSARALTVSGNQVKALAKSFASWNLGGRPGPFMGNISSGPCADRAAPASQFPAPASAFNMQ